MLAILWLLSLCWMLDFSFGYEELVETIGCSSCRLLLTCRHLTAIIAILKVDFVPDRFNKILEANIGFTNFTEYAALVGIVPPPPFPPVHPRDVLNKRCSGLNHCSFSFSEDCPGSELFGEGNITIQYACITEDRIHKYCNSEIHLDELQAKGISEGYIHNPGYPRFYPGQRECKWKIIGQAKQKIKITILDISLIVDKPSCGDILEIVDTGQVIFSTCLQEHPPSEIISGTESIEIVLKSTEAINPRRGTLLHYSAVGCPEFEKPSDAYLIHKDSDLLVFGCCVGYHFPDTGTRIKSVVCQGAFWNSSLPQLRCQKIKAPYQNQTDVIRIFPSKVNTKMAADILAPILLVVILFTVNAAVLFFIYRARKRLQLPDPKDEELGSFANSSPVE